MSGREEQRKKREDEKLRRLQMVVYFTMNLLQQQDLSLEEAVRHVAGVKKYALSLFPGKERAWEMIYEPRFNRLLRRKWGYVTRGPEDRVG